MRDRAYHRAHCCVSRDFPARYLARSFPRISGATMSIDLDQLSAKELDSLINKAKKRKTALVKRKPIAAVRRKLAALAKADGYSIAELFGGAGAAPKAGKAAAPGKGRKLGKVAPKYRNPANSRETWSGRGMQPRWLATEVRKGRKPEDFLINATLTPKPHKPGKTVVKATQAD
jgi:DNA-binding protein H-NS